MKVAILIFILFLLSCNSSEKKSNDNKNLLDEDNELVDDSETALSFTDFYANGAGMKAVHARMMLIE
jgi:hypothetical protein